MKITRKALERMKQLRDRAGRSSMAVVRLLLKDGDVCLRWDRREGNEMDFMITRGGLSIRIDAQTYLQLADYELDYDDQESRRFLLSPIGARRSAGRFPRREKVCNARMKS